MRRLWLIFAQAVTISVAGLFVLSTLKPEWLRDTAPASVVAILEAPADSGTRAAASGSYAAAAQRSMPAVVHIFTSKAGAGTRHPLFDDPMFRHFFGERPNSGPSQRPSGLGSGVIVSPDGYIITNNHVIETADQIEIALNDGRKFSARQIGRDPETDLAVLKIDTDDQLPVITLAGGDALSVGDMVLAIGNPFGVGQTVTSGIVSALARSEIGNSDLQVFIQTDAAINPGNSGGALVDMSGKLVGINTMIFSQSGGSQGIGFAIPSNLVRLYVEGATEGRKVERPWLGARLETVTRDLAEGLGLDRVSGAVVARVSNGGPAAQAGLQAGDVILHVDGFEVADARAVQYRLTTRGVGSTVRIGILRNGQPETVDMTLVAAPQPGKDDVRNLAGPHPLDGARVSNILPGVVDELGLDGTGGVVVLSVRRASTAARLGFQPGDIIAQIGNTPVTSVADLERGLAKRQRMWVIAVRRGDKVFNLQVPG